MPIRVGVNLLYLKPGVVGGTEVYVSGLLEAIASARDEVDVTLFVNRRFPAAHPHLTATFPVVVAPISGDRPPVRIAIESSWLARATARRPLDLVHHVANTVPQVRTRPAVVTIHDLQPFLRPGDFASIKGRYLRARIRAAARDAAVVITPSGYVRALVVERLGADPARVVVVPAPVAVRDPGGGDGPSIPFGIDGPFFLYPAITHPHKNHVALIGAFARVAALRPDVSLVLAGGRGRAEETVIAEIDRRGVRDRVRRVGRVPRGVLDALFRRATGLTFPSRHEGFGLPVAEAMALGCPVVASDVTALPEVVGDAGILLDPEDEEAWAEAMRRLLDEPELRTTLAERGRARASSFTGTEAAHRLASAYRLAVEGP